MTYSTQEAAIAAALSESAPGEQVSVHGEACASRGAESNQQAEEHCSCEPLVLVVGAKA